MTEIQAGAGAAVAAAPRSQDVPAIELENVVKEYVSHGEVVRAVKGVSLAIAEGEFFSLLGPSGCGKTTTMRMIAGFEEPTSGVVRLHGADVTNVPPNKRDVNMVFQSYALFPHMTVWENVAFGLKRKKVPADEIKRRVGEMLEIVHLQGRERRRPQELSGGQQQRVALARALVNRPRALLLDEPLGALDLKLRQHMQIELKRIQREVGITFVYVTHDQSEALTMSDRIAVMREGVVEQLADPREIYERPANEFVAGFIGTSNVLKGTIQQVTGGTAVLALSPVDRILVPVDGTASAGDAITMTVRPEKIMISTEQPEGDLSVVRGTVSEVVYLGTYNSYTVALADGAEVTVFQQNAHDSSVTAERGDTVWLSWQPRHSYVLR
ncbi:spermidine/putrescine import ATP-binding protein PotA [Thermobispora bispora]|uniref:Spermidine/putrescine import ATP-binding protein PotA n=1 Tax=Thermobispora bispora (strain ATCC 19993 / DSM 43833 / CBS 139.67 / JCM 10125 / KCTC 9307 / NBRC 14880 / R51) TaxID=469371 RepID=D6Y7D7_THEBD|nr:ABC transporter ATP-binding protein [Thermobispora bispora]ADG87732.1 spermidine/putrescine ABC transporter ATPase subunit [Thermobispora bispora DSM 43833]QSI47637.1 ABC transporter ATP-binding protein [Thermobispora bispora]